MRVYSLLLQNHTYAQYKDSSKHTTQMYIFYAYAILIVQIKHDPVRTALNNIRILCLCVEQSKFNAFKKSHIATSLVDTHAECISFDEYFDSLSCLCSLFHVQMKNVQKKQKNFHRSEKCTEKYRAIIDINSNRDKDKQQKQLAWESVKNDFDQYCKSQGLYVSKKFMSFKMNKKCSSSDLKINCERIISTYFWVIHIFQIYVRSIDSLQIKYKQLKRLARQEESQAKRDLVKSFNLKPAINH